MFKTLFALSTLAALGWGGPETVARFAPSQPEIGPYPSNALTQAQSNQRTGRQVSLPVPPGCSAGSLLSACSDVEQLNQLDGFSVNPRLRVCFSGSVDTGTLRAGILLASPAGAITGVNQVQWDPATNCAIAKPNQALNERTTYQLVVTNAIRDAAGKPIKPERDFELCTKIKSSNTPALPANTAAVAACGGVSRDIKELQDALDTRIVAATAFTTMSATAWLEQARSALSAAPVLLFPHGAVTVFPLADLQTLAFQPDSGSPQVTLPPQPLPLNMLNGVERIAFGQFLSPLYLRISGPQAGTIPNSPTLGQLPPPSLPAVPVSFHVYLPPASQQPAGGFPVAIFGHGFGDNQFGGTAAIAGRFTRQGIAVIGVELVGHGHGPQSTMLVTTKGGTTTPVPTPGRGALLPGSTFIGPTDGCIVPSVLGRDCIRQSAVDVLALIRTIQATQGLTLGLDPTRITYVGQSLGSFIGTLVHTTEPAIRSSVLNVGGAPVMDVVRLGIYRSLGTLYLAFRNPVALNRPGGFDDAYPLRDRPVQIITDPTVLPVQEAFEAAEWLSLPADPLAFATGLRRAPVLFQFAQGDLEVPNPTSSALIRAAGARRQSRYFLFREAAKIDPTFLAPLPGEPFPTMPHRYLTFSAERDPLAATRALISAATQSQAAGFLASNGLVIPDANQFLTGPFAGQNLFVLPAQLPDELNWP